MSEAEADTGDAGSSMVVTLALDARFDIRDWRASVSDDVFAQTTAETTSESMRAIVSLETVTRCVPPFGSKEVDDCGVRCGIFEGVAPVLKERRVYTLSLCHI